MLSDLVFTSPEAQGVRSEDILTFIRFVEENKINLHSFLFARGGNIIAEGYFPPFDKDFLHRLYSSSKTYVALAVGMLVTEGKLRVTDRVLDFFPEYDTDEVSDEMRECTLEDALMMATVTYAVKPPERPEKSNNPYAYRAQKPAGTIFNYGDGNGIATAIVERVSGMYLTDYLRPLLDTLGVSSDTWCVKDLDGTAWGGSGMISTLRDFAKVAEFVGNKGCHGGKQLIDRDYMERMTSRRIATVSMNSYSPLTSYGYGYQTWITPDAICMRGMGAQEAFYFQKSDLLFVCTGDTMCDTDFSDVRLYDAVKYLVLEHAVSDALPESDAFPELLEKLRTLRMPRYGEAHSPTEREVSGVRYALGENGMGWSGVEISFDGEAGVIRYTNARGEKEIAFSLGEYKRTTFPETHYYDKQRGVPSERELDCLAIGEWIEERKLLLRVYITDVSFGSIFAVISFRGDRIALQLKKRGEFLLDDYGGTAYGSRAEN